MRPALALALILIAATCATAGDAARTRQLAPGEKPPPAVLAEVAWLAGHWRGEALGGTVEELWSPPAGDGMMGSFRLQIAGKTRFYELMVIREVAGSLLLQLKHFHGDLKGWEERDETVDFRLVAVTDHAAFFEGFTIERVGPDQLDVWVVIGKGDDQQETLFRYQRVG